MTSVLKFTPSASADSADRATLNHVLITRLLAVAVGITLLIHLFTLTRYPTIFIDEGWLGNASWTWVQTGVNFDAMHTGTLDQFPKAWIWRHYLGQAPFSLSYALLGVGYFQTRVAAWAFGCILLFAFQRVASRLYNPTTAWLAVFLLAISVPFTFASRYRQDIVLATFIIVAFWLFLIATHENKRWPHFVAAFMIAIGIDIHTIGAFFIPAWGMLYIVQYGRRVFLEKGTWLAAIGGALGLGIFVAIHILPAPDTYASLMSFHTHAEGEARAPIASLSLSALVNSAYAEFGRYFDVRNVLDYALVGVGGLFFVWRRTKNDLLVVAFVVTTFLTFVLLSNNKTDLYAISLYPFMMLLVAETFVSIIGKAGRAMLVRGAALALLLLFVGVTVVSLASNLYQHRDYDPNAITDRMREVIPAGARVMGMPTWWIGLSEYDYRSSLNLAFYHFYNGYNVEQAIDAIHPDYIIVDDTQRLVLVDPDDTLPPSQAVYAVSRSEFRAMLDARGTRVLEFTDPWQGTFEVYQIDWET